MSRSLGRVQRRPDKERRVSVRKTCYIVADAGVRGGYRLFWPAQMSSAVRRIRAMACLKCPWHSRRTNSVNNDVHWRTAEDILAMIAPAQLEGNGSRVVALGRGYVQSLSRPQDSCVSNCVVSPGWLSTLTHRSWGWGYTSFGVNLPQREPHATPRSSRSSTADCGPT